MKPPWISHDFPWVSHGFCRPSHWAAREPHIEAFCPEAQGRGLTPGVWDVWDGEPWEGWSIMKNPVVRRERFGAIWSYGFSYSPWNMEAVWSYQELPNHIQMSSGWCFGTSGLWLSIYWESYGIIIPTDELIFFRGVQSTNQSSYLESALYK